MAQQFFEFSKSEKKEIEIQAKNFLIDYHNWLNEIGDSIIHEAYDLRDFFESENSKVYLMDLFCTFRSHCIADDYLVYIDKWFQKGISFKLIGVRSTIISYKQDTVDLNCIIKRKTGIANRKHRDKRKLVFQLRLYRQAINKNIKIVRIDIFNRKQSKSAKS